MSLVPLYDPASANPAYQLRYSWTGWPSAGRFPPKSSTMIDSVRALWEEDGLRLLEHRWTDEMVQLLFSARPNISPQLVAARAKGRLDHAARQAGLKLNFSRKLALRSIGDNSRRDVEAYIERQVIKERFADARYEAMLAACTIHDPSVDLSQPKETARGRYWYNLHVVLVVQGRSRISDVRLLGQLRDATQKVAAKKRHGISRLSVMPDHWHAALRPTHDETPLDVVFTYQNNLAHLLELGRIWAESFYVGTFGDYTTHAVHDVASRSDGG